MRDAELTRSWRGWPLVALKIALDPAILFFCALAAILLAFGWAAVQSVFLLPPGVILILYATSALLKYSAHVCRSLAMGLPLPSAESAVFDYLRMPWAFAPWIAALLLVTIGITFSLVGPKGLLFAFVGLYLPLWPAAAGIISVNTRPLSVFELPALLKAARIMGGDYLLAAVIWWALLLLAIAAQGLFAGVLPALLLVWQTVFLFVIMGVLLFRHRDALGMLVRRESQEARAAQYEARQWERDRRTALDQAYVFFSRDNPAGGQKRLRAYFEDFPEDDAGWDWFLHHMREWDLAAPAQLHAKNYLARLLKRDDTHAARALLIDCMQRDPTFSPHPLDRAAARELLTDHALAEQASRWR
ncbi:MAG: hypothetical protein AAGA84_11585 [Pseudomonadota bacterium]